MNFCLKRDINCLRSSILSKSITEEEQSNFCNAISKLKAKRKFLSEKYKRWSFIQKCVQSILENGKSLENYEDSKSLKIINNLIEGIDINFTQLNSIDNQLPYDSSIATKIRVSNLLNSLRLALGFQQFKKFETKCKR